MDQKQQENCYVESEEPQRDIFQMENDSARFLLTYYYAEGGKN